MRFFQAWPAMALITYAHGYWLMGIEDFITTERLDPLVNPGKVSGHVHSVLGGSNFRMTVNTASLRQSECTSTPILEDKSAYWFPQLYYEWANGSFTSLNGGAVIYYLFDDKPGTTTAFPDDFRMLSGNPTLRTYDPQSYDQQAITFLCLDFSGTSTRHNELPAKVCPSGIRAQVNFPSCWDGKNLDSPDHKSHVAFKSGGPDSGSCSDPKFPVTLPRIFIEVYWNTGDVEKFRSQAKNPSQPFVYSYGDTTGYGYHADFINGWDKGVLQRAIDNCHCNINGDPHCCAEQGIFTLKPDGQSCRITKAIDEQTTGTLPKLPGNNPVQPAGKTATLYSDPNIPALLSPIYAYTGNTPPGIGTVVVPPAQGSSTRSTAAPTSAPGHVTSTPITSKPASSSHASSVEGSSSSAPTTSEPAASSSPTLSTGSQVSASHGTFLGGSSSAVPTSECTSTGGHDTSTPVSHSVPTTPVSGSPTGSHTHHHSSTPVAHASSGVHTTSHAAPTTIIAPPSSGSGTNNPPEGDDDDEPWCDEVDDDYDDDTQPSSGSTSPPSQSGGSSHHQSAPPASQNEPPPAYFSPANGVSPDSGSSMLPSSSSACPARKFRHKYLREQKAAKEAEAQKRSIVEPFHQVHRAAHHEHGRRFMMGSSRFSGVY